MQIKRPVSKQPIPKNAKRVFDGKIFDVYQWQQKQFDGTFKTFEKIKRQDTVNVIPVTEDGQIVLSKQEQPGTEPFIGSFGGSVHGGEDPLDTAKRELLEETGYEAQEFILWDAVQFIDKIDWAIYTFIAKGCKKVNEQELDSGEHIELLLISFDEYLNLVVKENYRDSEIALKFFRISKNPHQLKKTRELFLM